MAHLETLLDKLLDQYFHLPTLISLALLGLVLIWWLYDLNLAVGSGFIRLSTNQGNLNLYWLNGCCDLSW